MGIGRPSTRHRGGAPGHPSLVPRPAMARSAGRELRPEQPSLGKLFFHCSHSSLSAELLQSQPAIGQPGTFFLEAQLSWIQLCEGDLEKGSVLVPGQEEDSHPPLLIWDPRCSTPYDSRGLSI